MMDTDAILVVLAGPAGSGKSTLCDRLVAEQKGFSRVITATTRPPREGECDGVHYHFLSPEAFDHLIEAKAFLEWAWVHKRHRYGTLKRAVLGPLAAGQSLVINIDVQGVISFLAAKSEDALLHERMLTVFIDLDLEVSRSRLVQRGTENQEEIERRMQTALAELRQKHLFDAVLTSRTREEDFTTLLQLLAQHRKRLSEKRSR